MEQTRIEQTGMEQTRMEQTRIEQTDLRFLCDAHAHIGSREELRERRESKIPSLLCASNPMEADRLAALCSEPENESFLIPTFGLHPWYADRFRISDMEPFFSQCSVIGEIGMDSVWCDVPLDIQEKVFTGQLAMASGMKKPVILHTKGQEKRIASLISEFPNTYLVHWYSSPEFPKQYLELDCYFSIGPDVWWNPDVRKLAAGLPADRILIETDGLGAVTWSFDEAPEELRSHAAEDASSSIRSSLSYTLAQTAEIRRLPVEEAGSQIVRNFHNCFKRDCHKSR